MSSIDQKTEVLIVGSLRIQNELISGHIESTMGITCSTYTEFNQISFKEIKSRRVIILLDYKCVNWRMVLTELKQSMNFPDMECFAALFNFNPAQGVEREITKLGVRGILYENSTCELLIKCINAILKEDIWFSRDLMKKILFELRFNDGNRSEAVYSISLREKEVLNLLVSGFTNDMISEKLCISLHTVKTHIYKIYKKINVHNRLQAVRWANHNIQAYN